MKCTTVFEGSFTGGFTMGQEATVVITFVQHTLLEAQGLQKVFQ